MLTKMQKISGFLFFPQFCITCILQGRWNGAFISNIYFYLKEILIVTLKCHYHNSIAIVSPLSQYYCNGVSTIAIVKMGAIVTPNTYEAHMKPAYQEHSHMSLRLCRILEQVFVH